MSKYQRRSTPALSEGAAVYSTLLSFLNESGTHCGEWFTLISAPGNVGKRLQKVYEDFEKLCQKLKKENSDVFETAYEAFMAEVRHRFSYHRA